MTLVRPGRSLEIKIAIMINLLLLSLSVYFVLLLIHLIALLRS